MIVAAIFIGAVALIFWSLLPLALGRMAQQLYDRSPRNRRTDRNTEPRT